MTQLDRWRGDWGDAYTARNIVDPASRQAWFNAHIPTDVEHVLEVGANRGHNLRAIQAARPDVWVCGTEPNATARKLASEAGTDLFPYDVYGVVAVEAFDLVFTSGVLIHVPPERLDEALTRLYSASRKYVLAIEYRRDELTPLEYRGHTDLLWAADYGAEYQRLFPDLELIDEGEATEADGFDNAYYWLMRKEANGGD